MGKTKIKTIDDSAQIEKKEKPSTQVAQAKKKPKDALAASLLEELNKEFGEVKKSAKKEVESKKAEDKKKPSVAKAIEAKPKEEKIKPRGKKYQEATKDIDPNLKYNLKEAVELVQKSSYTKFPGTVEIHINTQIKNIRGLVSLPYASGKKLRVLAFGPSTSSGQVKELEEMAVQIGTEEKIADLEKGKGLDFDVLVTTPEWMPKFAKIAKVLGPRGLMPNPKNGTITNDLKKTVAELQAGKTEYKTEPNGQVIHLGLGKVNQPALEIAANVKALYTIIGRSKISKIILSPTMGPGIKVDLGSI